MNKRVEATIEEWRKLYGYATTVKEIKPWNDFGNLDLISLQFTDEEEPVYICILGKGGDTFGIACYQGLSGLNDFTMLIQRECLGLTVEYAMFSQNNLTCYWGNRDEISKEQYDIIKQLGYKYRGRDNWLYFVSYKAGYFPYNLDNREVKLITKYLEKLIDAVNWYRNNAIEVEFDKNKSFHFYYDDKAGEWKGKSMKLPVVNFSYSILKLNDKELIDSIKKSKKSKCSLEADLIYLGAAVNDKKYERPANPQICILADHKQGMVLDCQMAGPDEDAKTVLANELINHIVQYGAPESIAFRSIIAERALRDICEVCNIKMERVKTLDIIDDFIYDLRTGG